MKTKGCKRYKIRSIEINIRCSISNNINHCVLLFLVLLSLLLLIFIVTAFVFELIEVFQQIIRKFHVYTVYGVTLLQRIETLLTLSSESKKEDVRENKRGCAGQKGL